MGSKAHDKELLKAQAQVEVACADVGKAVTIGTKMYRKGDDDDTQLSSKGKQVHSDVKESLKVCEKILSELNYVSKYKTTKDDNSGTFRFHMLPGDRR